MTIRKWLVGVTAFVLFSSCSVFSQPAKPVGSPPKSNLLVSGELVRSKESYDFKGRVVFAEDAYAVVTLTYVSGIIDMTGGAGTVVEPDVLSVTQRIGGIKSFPIRFHLEGDPKEVFRFPAHDYGHGGYYSLSAEVFMGADDKLYIGDFSDVFLDVVYGPTSGVQLKLSRVEDCDSLEPSAVCSYNKRPK